MPWLNTESDVSYQREAVSVPLRHYWRLGLGLG